MTAVPAVEINDLCVTFGGKVILDHLNLTIEHDKSVALIGPSGAGKSILLQCILGLHQPNQGTIKINGQDITRASHSHRKNIQRQIGMLFQNAALFDSLTVGENIIFGVRAQRRISHQQAHEMAKDLLSEVGLTEDVLHLYPSDLSGGMQKRVGLARTIATNPEIILFDEPTTGLDPIMSTVINHLIGRITQRPNTSALTITHDMQSASTISSSVAMLYKGHIIWQGTPQSLLTTDNPYVHQFVHGGLKGPLSTLVKT